MRLLQVKIRGLGDLPETDWLQLGPLINLFRFKNPISGRLFLQAVESLNPPGNCSVDQPFSGLPQEMTTREGYLKIVKPAKRTIAMGIFDCPADLVRELGQITPPLYETDRIEVGRRFDYSRWINFVELASSSRWSEVSPDLRRLCGQLDIDHPGQERITHLLDTMAGTDRIKENTAQQLEAWLKGVKDDQQDMCDVEVLLEKVARWRRFGTARQLVEEELPLMMMLPLQSTSAKEMTALVGDAQKRAGRSPILLVDLLGEDPAEAEARIEVLRSSSLEHQSLVFVNGAYRGSTPVPEQNTFS